MERYIILLCLVFFSSIISAQSVFDRMEIWLKNHELEVNYGPQLSWYKNSHIRFVQGKYDRDIIIQWTKARSNPLFNFYVKGQLGVPQFRVNIGVNISKKYSIAFLATHLNYLVEVDREYYKIGTWNGLQITGTELLSNDFLKLEHSNGINLWNIGVRRNFWIKSMEDKNVRIGFGHMPNVGMVLTATQAEVRNPSGDFEHYDPGNSLAGINFGAETTFILLFKNHWEFVINANYFQMLIYKAKLEDESYVNQRMRGINYGFSLGYRF